MNLKELLNKYDKIEIPMLQRDYAQGRKSQISIANEFLDAIFAVLEGKRETLHIDFIYGYKENNKFLLIDGQQRITTLWLLHFYIYKKANITNCKCLEKFSYSVRKSSKKFCQNLLTEDFDLLLKPSESIAKKVGTFESLENLNNDPTIKAMLNMLDLIYGRIKNKKDFLKLANNLNNITFDEFDMDMGDFKLGEELYIKMNARGKQLSRYENLKSFIQKGKVAKDKELPIKIDNDWSDYFFDSNNVESFDGRGLNFLHYANLFFKFENEENIDNLREIIQNPNRPIDEFYAPLQNVDNIKLLDKTIKMYVLFKHNLPHTLLKMRDSTFFSGNNISYADISYFFATLFFAKNSSNLQNERALRDYLRVCRNLIENYPLDSHNDIKYFFARFKELSQGCDNIYQFLRDNPLIRTGYDSEIRKAKLILDYRSGKTKDNWEEIFDKTSDNSILVGKVDFLLDFSDFNFKYETYNNNKSYDETRYGFSSKYTTPNFEKFYLYANLTMQIFDEIQRDSKFLFLFQRAFLSVGNYGFESANHFYGNYCGEIYRDREAWNWLLSGIRNQNKLPYFQKLLDVLLESKENNLADKMKYVIEHCDLSQKQWWEQLLIKQKGLFEFLNRKRQTFQRASRIRFWWNENNYIGKVELLPATRSTRNVADLFDYGFYLYCKDKGIKNLSEYKSEEKQYGDKYPLQPHFTINNKKVLCNSMKYGIEFGNKAFIVYMKEGIFKEFDRIINEMNICK